MNAMEQAFARVGINGYGVRQVGRTLQPRPKYVPDPSVPAHNTGIATAKERAVATVAEIGALTDDALEVEIIALTQNIEQLRSEIRGLEQEPELHERGWRRRAERALAGIKARLAICVRDRERRKLARQEQERAERAATWAERQERHQQALAEAQARKETAAAAHEEREAKNALAFVRHARSMLPRETLLSIWAAVNAEAKP